MNEKGILAMFGANGSIKITKHGCCDSLTTAAYFNLLSGRNVFSSTLEPVEISVPDGGYSMIRYVAFHSSAGGIRPAEYQSEKDLSGIFYYSSENDVISKLALYSNSVFDTVAKLKPLYRGKMIDTTSLSLVGVAERTDKAALSGFSIVLILNDSTEIILPFTNDSIDISRVTTPPGYRLVAIK